MRSTDCYLCGANDYNVLFPGNIDDAVLTADHVAARKGSVTKEVSYNWVRCCRCGLVYANPAPGEEVLAALYASSDQSDYGDETDNIATTYGSYLRKYSSHLVNKGFALDIGAGNGFFLRVLLSFGFAKVAGIEPSITSCKNAAEDVRSFLVNKMFSKDDFPPGSFDLVSCFQTLEHVPDPNALLASIAAILAPEGIVYCVAHNFGSIGVKLFGSKHPIVNAGHLTLFDEKTISAMFSKYFDVIAVFPISNKYSVRYWLSLFPCSEKLKSAISGVLASIGIEKIPLTMRLGNMGIIAKKRIS